MNKKPAWPNITQNKFEEVIRFYGFTRADFCIEKKEI